MDDGEIVNVLVELETDGEVDIWIQVLKLSEDTWIEPEHDVPEEFVITEVLSIDSEKVTDIFELTDMDVSKSDGEVDNTVGGVISELVVWLSEVVELLEVFVSFFPQELNNRNSIENIPNSNFLIILFWSKSFIKNQETRFWKLLPISTYLNSTHPSRFWGVLKRGEWMGERENKKRKNSCEKVSHLEGLCPLSIGTLTYPRMGNQSKRGTSRK